MTYMKHCDKSQNLFPVDGAIERRVVAAWCRDRSQSNDGEGGCRDDAQAEKVHVMAFTQPEAL